MKIALLLVLRTAEDHRLGTAVACRQRAACARVHSHNSGGTVLNAPDLRGAKLPGLSVEDATVRIVGDTDVLVARLVPQDKSAADLDASNVFVREDGEWKMLAAHLSPHPGK